MRLPLSLIESFFSSPLSPEQIADILTAQGIEVDQILYPSLTCPEAIAAKIVHIEKHPKAKNLLLITAFDGREKRTIACSDLTCRIGEICALAPIGAAMKDPEKGEILIKKTEFQGIESSGMFLSALELGLYNDNSQVLRLPEGTLEGTVLKNLFTDPVFELSLTPNLGHCLSALGIARELSYALKEPLERPELFMKQAPFNWEIVIEDFSLCSDYMCCLIEDIEIGASPFSLRLQLENCGQKAINNIVDTTNWIMMKTGQPMHAFDADCLEGNSLTIAPLDEEETFVGLDNVERIIAKGTLVIRDKAQIAAIAGVIGAAYCGVSEKTKRVLFESAHFCPQSVRKSIKTLGIKTQSALRFEKGVDPLGVEPALIEAALLIEKKVVGVARKTSSKERREKPIAFRIERINAILGTKLSQGEIEEIFSRLEMKPRGQKVHVPSFRFDIVEEIDLIEEIARIYGYQNIEKKEAHFSSSTLPHDPMYLFQKRLRATLLGFGLFEFLTCDLISPQLAQIGKEIAPSSIKPLTSSYSKSEEYSVLRTSLLPNLLSTLQNNFSRRQKDVAGFEIGNIHFLQGKKCVEVPMLAIVLSGKKEGEPMAKLLREYDFFDLKGMCESLVEKGHFIRAKHLAFHPQRQADFLVGQQTIGSLGQIHPKILEKFGIKEDVYYAEIDLEHLKRLEETPFLHKSLSDFPSSERDWTLTLPQRFAVGSLFQKIEEIESPLLERAVLVDVYIKNSETKNVTLRMIYRHEKRSLNHEEVEKAHSEVLASLTNYLQNLKD